MSQLGEVIRNKNKVEKMRRARRKDELGRLRTVTAYRAKLFDELKKLDIILQDKDVESVIIEVPDKQMALFTEAMYEDDLIGFEVQQDEESPNKFYIRKRYITF